MPASVWIQFGMLALTGVLFAAAFLLGWRHMRRAAEMAQANGGGPLRLSHESTMGGAARGAVIAAIVLGVGLLAWRATGQTGGEEAARRFALRLTNPFDAFLVLGLLLAIMAISFRRTRHLRSLSFFLLPMIVVLLALGIVLAAVHSGGVEEPRDPRNIWIGIHVIAIVAATVCFALGCVGAVVYLRAARQLRHKGGTTDMSSSWLRYPPLASVEKFNQVMTYCGFPLLTIATFSGILRLAQAGGFAGPGEMVKLGCGALSWAVYAVLLHVPPRFRGRRAAWMSIVGFAVFTGGFIASRWS